MSNYRQLYYGPFMRVWMPEVTVGVNSKTCTNEKCEKHGEHIHHNFCPHCGAEVKHLLIQKPSHLNLHEFLEEELNDQDLFTAVYPDNVDYIIAVSNRRAGQGGVFFEDDPKTEVLLLGKEMTYDKSYFDKEDWKKFSEALAKKDIKHEALVGVLQWFS